MYPTRYATLRDRRHWQATLRALSADGDGVLSLSSLPQPLLPYLGAAPYAAASSGLAAGDCCDLFVADTAHDAVWYLDRHCAQQARLAPTRGDCLGGAMFHTPRGLAFARRGLYVADAGSARVLLFRTPDLRLARVIDGPWQAPRGVAVDGMGRVYVLDGVGGIVRRLDARGRLDSAYNQALAPHLTQAQCIALGADATLIVSDAFGERVLRFAADGTLRAPLPAARSGWQPRTLAAWAARTYVADASSGRIDAYDDDALIGAVPGYIGPVSAMAVGSDGTLYIKPGSDREIVVACANAGIAADGALRAGPFDAGTRDDWQRVALDARIDGDARVELEVFCAPDASLPPADNEWLASPARDVLLGTLTGMPQARAQRRFLWLRVRVAAGNAGANVRLKQLQAMTSEENYLQHLPAVYAENDDARMLERYLALARSELRTGELSLADLPRLARPDFAPEQALPWLAQWLAFGLPEGLTTDEHRMVLARAHEYYRLRDTVAGLLAFVHLYSGARARLIEWHQQQRIWQLGVTSALGFDTALPAASPDGIVVPDPAQTARGGSGYGCAVPERVVVGHAVVGVDRPQAPEDFGAALFDDSAYRISVLVPAGQAPSAALRAIVEETVAAQAPAHVRYDVCFIEPRLRIGIQARIGIDAIVAGDGEPLRLEQGRLDQDSRLGGDAAPGSGIGHNARVGQQLRLG